MVRMPRKSISVVIPAYNEERNIGSVLEAVFSSFSASRYRVELIVVDDGSDDRTSDVVKGYVGRYPVTLVSLTRNFGKETALLAGLDRARGDATVLMDADLQQPVELIHQFLAHWEAGYQCVYAVKQHRKGETLLKRVLTKLFYWVLNGGSKVRITADAQDFRLLDKSAVQALCSIRERVRFTKGLYAWLGVRSIGVPFVPAPRRNGASRFNTRALFRLGWDGLTSFSDLPLRLSALVGFCVSSAAVVYAAYIVVRTLVFGIDVPGWATLTVAIAFLSGLQILFLGVIGEYVRNVYIETKQRPNYLLREVVSSDTERGRLDSYAGGRDPQSERVAAA